MKTVNLFSFAEKIIAARQNGVLPVEHPSVLEGVLREALADVSRIDVGGGTQPTVVEGHRPNPLLVSSLHAQVGGNHYQDMPISHAEFCQRNGLTWCEASATKYLCRHRKKNKLQDALKALHYTIMMLDFEYPGWRQKEEAKKLLVI